MAAKKSPVAKKSKVVSKPAPAAAKKPAPAPAKAVPAKAAPAKSAAKVAPAVVPKPKISPEERWKLVAEAAYYLAEKRHFAAGHSEADWLAAERQVDAKLKS